MGKDTAPAPNYTAAAQATAQGNLQNLNAQTAANRPNQVTPWGTSTWTQTPTVDQAGYNAALSKWQQSNSQGTWVPPTAGGLVNSGSGDSGSTSSSPGSGGYWTGSTSDGTSAPTLADYTNNQWTQNMTLTPAEQQALNSQQAIQQNQSNLAQTLQGQVASTMKGGFQAPQLGSYMNGVPSTNTNFGNFTPSGVNAVDQQAVNPQAYTAGDQRVGQNLGTNSQGQNQNFQSGAQNVNTNANGAVAGAGSVNQSTPQFSDATAQAGAQSAYNASHGLVADQQSQDTAHLDQQLRLQGLTPGTEAYNNAAQNLSRTQSQQNDQLANQAVLTGNQEANTNYASALAGYNSNLGAQQQAYSQGANTFTLGNTAEGQQYTQAAGANTMNNAASSTQFNNDLAGFNSQNAARTQAMTNSLSQYQAALQGQSAYNAAQGQSYNQALAGYGANQTAQQAGNAAQAQAYSQGMNSYQTAYQAALNNYNMPLNEMNAVLNGQQVQNPTMPSFATAGNVAGTDYTGAANMAGQYASGATAANNASSSATTGAVGGIAAAAMIAF